jgi:hypothetical protein
MKLIYALVFVCLILCVIANPIDEVDHVEAGMNIEKRWLGRWGLGTTNLAGWGGAGSSGGWPYLGTASGYGVGNYLNWPYFG